MDLTAAQLIQGGIAAFLVGFSKTGLTGLGILIVPLMAAVFPGKESTGALLPMLILGDLFAVAWYRQHAQWKIVLRLLPWIVPGLLLGAWTLRIMDDRHFYPLLGGMVLALIGVQAARDRGGEWMEERLPHEAWFAALVGLAAGFATMVGNVAGAIMGIYLIAMGLDKRSFMGTGAWYYLLVNCAKVPFSAGLGLITASSLLFNLAVAPLVVLGAFAGLAAFRRIPQKVFNGAVILLAGLAALRLIWMGWRGA